mgnify:CR=1 FL=1
MSKNNYFFTEQYEDRNINSLYFDSAKLTELNNTLDGLNMKKKFRCQIGLSDHTISNNAAIASVALDICFIEKHFTINPKLRLSDNPFSVCPDEMEDLVYKVKKAFKYMGSGEINKILVGFYTINGLAFSPDYKTDYVSDSAPWIRTIWSYDYDLEDGVWSNKKVFFDTHQINGRPDGGCVDAEGCYWMAGVSGWELVRITPKGKIDKGETILGAANRELQEEIGLIPKSINYWSYDR